MREARLNSSEGVGRLASMSMDDEYMVDLANEIARTLDVSLDAAKDLLRQWQTLQADVREKLEEQRKEMEKAKQMNRKALVPIWRCGVCGREDKPYISCYVAPFIVRYEEDMVD
eukprot:gene2424-4709_t